MTAVQQWLWPSGEEINDFPDPLGFEAEWKPWAGAMADGPKDLAEIFCREYIQNSWDSIQERIARLVADGHEQPTGYGVTFRFVRLQSDVARAFAERFGLMGHVDRHEGMNTRDRRDNRLENSDIASGEFGTIALLIASETYGEGMVGPWDTKGRSGVVSRLKSAVMQTSSSKNNEAAGGSWGHGKKAIANASWCRTLAVYSCSEPYEGDVDAHGTPITRRFLGATYWRRHDLGDRAHVGLGLGGFVPSGSYSDFRPLRNDEADDLVRSLAVPGLTVRSAGEPSQTGVSYLIVEPSFSPEDLAAAVLRNWWPLLEVAPDAVQIHGFDHRPLDLDPASMPVLRPFREAFALAAGRSAPRAQGDLVSTVKDVALGEVGVLALTSDVREGGWSYEMPDDNASLVALVRNDMVIAYEKSPRRNRSKPPFVRGVLVVDRHANAAASAQLKMAEPHLHNEWIATASPSVPRSAADFAKKVLDKVHKGVTDLRSQLKTDDAKRHEHFPAFSKLFAAGRSSTTTKRDKDDDSRKKSRSFSIQFQPRLHDADVDDPTRIRMMSTVKIALLPKRAKDAPEVEAVLDLGWKVLEERGAVRDPSLSDPSSIVLPQGFTIGHDGKIRGSVTAEPVVFEWRSRFYPDDWQVVPDPEIDEAAGSERGAA